MFKAQVGISDRDLAVLRAVDSGASAAAVAVTIGVTRTRVHQILRAWGRGSGQPRPAPATAAQCEWVLADFAEHGHFGRAAAAGGMGRTAARRILGAAGLAAPVPKRREVTVAAAVLDSAGGSGYDCAMTTACEAAADGEPAAINARYLSLADRLAIADGLIHGRTVTAIAVQIGKHKSTVSREIRGRSPGGIYTPYWAHHAAAEARARPKTAKLVAQPRLRDQVQADLTRRLSPEQISNRLVKDFPDDETMRVSHETIYQALYIQARGALKREVAHALRTGRTRRKPQGEARKPRFVDDMVNISDRPAEVDDRAVEGHWEGDLIMGADNKSAIGTVVERTTRYTLLVHLPGGHTAEEVRDALIATISTLPAHLRGSLTWEQGCEMARHKGFAIATDMAVYFCDPASPWQRGTNENTVSVESARLGR